MQAIFSVSYSKAKDIELRTVEPLKHVREKKKRTKMAERWKSNNVYERTKEQY